MQIAVFSQILKPKDAPFVQQLFDAFHHHGITVYIYKPYFESLKEKIIFKSNIDVFEGYADPKMKSFDYMIALGGDGTMLAAVTLIRDQDIPILGINLGRLGFMAMVNKTQIYEAIEMVVNGRFYIGQRRTLYLESDPPLFGDMPFALNDFTILKRDTSSMISIHCFVNGDYLNTCLLYTSPSPRDRTRSRMPSSA